MATSDLGKRAREEAKELIRSFGFDLAVLEGAIAAALLSTRREAIEECAKVVDEIAEEHRAQAAYLRKHDLNKEGVEAANKWSYTASIATTLRSKLNQGEG